MAVSSGNIGFNDITQEIYGRAPQVGDNLLQMFEDAPENGFNPLFDIGIAGPGDAMSEFKSFDKNGLTQGMWESYYSNWSEYTPDNIYQKYFSTEELKFKIQIKPKKFDTANVSFDGPVMASLQLGGITISTTDVSSSLDDFIYFNIDATSEIPNGVYNIKSEIMITLQDASGNIVNAIASSIFTHLHIYDVGTSAHRWQWSSSDIDSYPIVYPTATYSIANPISGSVPGSNSPAINVKITNTSGFLDIEAYIFLQFKGTTIGNELDGWVALGSSFITDINKKLIFDVQIIRDFMDVGNDILNVLFLPRIKLIFSNGAFSTEAELDISLDTQYYKILTQTDTSFTWEWVKVILEDPIVEDNLKEDPLVKDTEIIQ